MSPENKPLHLTPQVQQYLSMPEPRDHESEDLFRLKLLLGTAHDAALAAFELERQPEP